MNNKVTFKYMIEYTYLPFNMEIIKINDWYYFVF